jgi:phosphomannomutase
MAKDFENASSCWKAILSDVNKNRKLLSIVEHFARENDSPATIVFGTSGWRGEIGTDYTFRNVRIVTSAIMAMFKSNENRVMKAMGVKDFDEIKRRGIIVGHDNRYLGTDFALEVLGILQKEGIKTWYAGEATTPEFSTGIEMLGAACSINLTPSHNPANFAGYKFNPSDGGPAGPEITNKIEKISNRMMKNDVTIESAEPKRIEKIDLTELYMKFLKQRMTLDLEKIRAFIAKEDCCICIDNVHGSTRGRIEKILGRSNKIIYLRTEDDVLFEGISPEPSEQNMHGIEKVLKSTKARFKLGVLLDPDGDRIRHADGSMQIPMNYFGAMAFHYLKVYKGISGVVVKSLGTSNLVNAIAEKLQIPVKETKVGFKNFRPYMLRRATERAIVAFEESDGITVYNHTLEKDALLGVLLAIEMMAVTGKNLSTYLKDIMDEFGYYYPDRSGIAVDRSLAGEQLKKKLSIALERFKKGTSVTVGKESRTIRDATTIDGTKLVFDDGSWLVIRPSGTEPKVRFYIESRTKGGKRAVFKLAEQMTKEALGIKK